MCDRNGVILRDISLFQWNTDDSLPLLFSQNYFSPGCLLTHSYFHVMSRVNSNFQLCLSTKHEGFLSNGFISDGCILLEANHHMNLIPPNVARHQTYRASSNNAMPNSQLELSFTQWPNLHMRMCDSSHMSKVSGRFPQHIANSNKNSYSRTIGLHP